MLAREGAGYDKVFQSGYGLEEGLSWSLEKELSARSLVDEEEFLDRDEVEEREGNEDDEGEGGNEGELEVEDDKYEDESEGGAFMERSLGSLGDGHTRPFILPEIWTINDFKPMMTTKIFNNLRVHYQILDNIPICLPGKYEKCYSRNIADIGMYDAMLIPAPPACLLDDPSVCILH